MSTTEDLLRHEASVLRARVEALTKEHGKTNHAWQLCRVECDRLELSNEFLEEEVRALTSQLHEAKTDVRDLLKLRETNDALTSRLQTIEVEVLERAAVMAERVNGHSQLADAIRALRSDAGGENGK